MSGDTQQVAAFGPAAVAVHDDGDMFRELVRIELAVKFSFFSVQPRGNGSQYSTLAQQLWPCNLSCFAGVSEAKPSGSPQAKSRAFCARDLLFDLFWARTE